MVWSKTFKKVEEALGFELYDWQKDFISMEIDFIPVGGRANGKTLAFILRYLLNYEIQIKMYPMMWKGPYYEELFPVDMEKINILYIHDWYPRYILEIDRKLKSVGLETYLN